MSAVQPGRDQIPGARAMKASSLPHIALDGFNLAMPRGTGVATYAQTLSHTAQALGYAIDLIYGLNIPNSVNPALREVMFFSTLNEESAAAPSKSFKRSLRRALMSPGVRRPHEIPITGDVITESFRHRLPAYDRLFNLGSLFNISNRYFERFKRFLPIELPNPPAIMHWTYPLPIRLRNACNIYTIHDLVPLRLPHTSSEDKRFHRRLIQECLRADHVVTVSNSSREDILRLFPNVDPKQVTNTYQAIIPDTAALSIDADQLAARLKSLFDLTADGYLLYFGALEPKKNIGRLLEAYVSSDIATPLVIVGAQGWRSDEELRLLRGAHGSTLSSLGRVRQFSYLPRDLLMLLVRGAKAVTFPSIYEGFGLPVLEAMSLGTPVLTSNTSSLREIARGDAALLIDPYDVGDIRSGLLKMDEDPTLRARLSAAGRLRAQEFSQERYATRIDDLYRSLSAAPDARAIRPEPRLQHSEASA